MIVREIFRKFIPKSLRKLRSKIREENHWNHKKKEIREFLLSYFKEHDPGTDTELQKVAAFIREHDIAVIPDSFTDEYKASDVSVLYDNAKDLPYCIYENKRLYYKRGWTNKQIKKYHAYLLAEQDKRSPHCYLTPDFDLLPGEVMVDAGAAEGILALHFIEKCSAVYLFEPDKDWVEALNATFEPWEEKTTIISKLLGKEENDQTTTLDRYFSKDNLPNFVKIDVEGAEMEVLHGFTHGMISETPIKLAVCTYHKQGDETEMNSYLTENNFKTEFSAGYVIFYYDNNIQAPYLRRCLIRATKSKGEDKG